MGRSSTSCFKIITCSSDAVEKDDLPASESKGVSDKRGWSFRKKSARHRVLSNTVVSETPSSGNKESPDSAIVNFQMLTTTSIDEKTSAVNQIDDKSQLSISVDSKESNTIVYKEDDSKAKRNPDESDIIVIQSALRGYLAQRELLKLKNVVKLQAVVRGHLVRRHAIGTLRCVQAIIKMQALIRARRARLLLEKSSAEGKVPEKHDKESCNQNILAKENLAAKPQVTYTSIEKLLSNGFARQLLESTPRTKHIHVKCDPLRSDSAWRWLERWMSVSSVELEQSQKSVLNAEQQEEENIEHSASQLDTEISSESHTGMASLKLSIGDTVMPSDGEDNLITYDATNSEFEVCQSSISSMMDDDLEKSQQEDMRISDLKEKNSLDFHSNQTNESELIPPMELNSHSSKPDIQSEQPRLSSKRVASEQLESEGKKFVIGSRKASNPAFIAAQSKFVELSSTVNSSRSISLSNEFGGVESIKDVTSSVDETSRTREIEIAGNSVVHNSMIQVGGSDCGTELSISSTLDSPDESEAEAIEVEHGAKLSEKVTSKIESTKCLDLEPKDEESTPESESYSMTVQPEKLDDDNVADGEEVNSVSAMDSSEVKQNIEENASDLHIELDSHTGHQAYKSSPEASPRSHVTVLESQGTPSSQVSVKAKKAIGDKNGSKPKRRSSSAGKQSPSNPNHDSGARNSSEQLPKDHKTGKRRNSFGSSKPDLDNQEPRDSSSSNSLPSYMQATESARAKAQANGSPRSSPDVQDKDVYIKKRHSLPGANGRQGSPRIQRSMSQAQQGAKGNGPNSQEKKWQR